MQWLDDDGQLERAPYLLRSVDDLELGRRYPVVEKALFGPRLVETDPQRQRVTAGIGDTPELAEGGDVRLTAGTPQPFREVEDDIGPGPAQGLGEARVGLQPDHLAGLCERALDRLDGRFVVPLCEGVLELEGALGRPRWVDSCRRINLERTLRGRVGWQRRQLAVRRLQVEGKSDAKFSSATVFC